jgi:hypothetical protein
MFPFLDTWNGRGRDPLQNFFVKPSLKVVFRGGPHGMSGQHSEQSIEGLLLCSRCASQLLDALRPVLQQVRDSEFVSNVQAPRCQIAQGQAEYDFRR